ncbi:MAG: DoxX family membrane protein [Patescibacteria group bacterium]
MNIKQFLFADRRMAWLWLIVRLYVGWVWLMAGWEKIGNPAWTGDQAGIALAGFVKGALAKTVGEHPDVSGWYASFLQNFVASHTAFWSYLVAYGEVLVGIALILGLFTTLAAFFGGFMNLNYLLAGTVSINPQLLVLALLLLVAHKIAGWWGLDRFVLPKLRHGQ